jgi:cysteine desulfurase
MPKPRIYLDHNATTPLHPKAREAMLAALDLTGNASSIHAEGRHARLTIEDARAEVADFVGVAPKNVVFTSGGTEALNLALTPNVEVLGARSKPVERIFISGGEHPSVVSGHRFTTGMAETIGLTASGLCDLDALRRSIETHAEQGFLLALQAANNETGVIQPVAAAADLVHAAGGLLICDAVQAAGKTECQLKTLGADALILSAHKFGGPKGVGALCFASHKLHIKEALLRGGGQERGLRAGTENIAAIAGFGAAIHALKSRMREEASRLALWRNQLETDILCIAPDSIVFGGTAPRLPNTSCFAVPGVEAQVLLMILDVEGIAISSGSACSSGKVKRSHVLTAMGVQSPIVEGAIRVSLGWNTQKEDCAFFVQALAKAVLTIRAKQAAAARTKSAA